MTLIAPERRAILTCFSAALLGQFAAGLGAQMVASALPDIQASLGVSADEASWISTAYAVGEIMMIPIASMVLQLLGLRRYMAGLATLFIVTACASAMVRSLETEIALRALQGVAGGGFGVAAFGLTFRAFGGRNIAFGLMLLTLVQTVPASLGAVLAGWLTAVDGGWTLVYAVEIALAAIVLAEALAGRDALPCYNWRVFRAADWWGYALLAPGLGLLIAGLSQGARRFWWDNDMVVLLLGSGVALIGAFIALEWGRHDGIVDFALLRRRSFAAAIGLNIAFRLALLVSGTLDPQFLALFRAYRPLELVPAMGLATLVQIAGFPLAYWLLRHVPPRAAVASGLAAFAAAPLLLLAGADSAWAGDQFLIAQALLGLAAPLFVVPLLVIGTREVKPAEGASASTFFNGSRALAQQAGTAILTTLIRTREQVHAGLLGETITPLRVALGGHAPATGALVGRIRAEAFAMAYDDAFVALGAVLALATLFALALPPVARLAP